MALGGTRILLEICIGINGKIRARVKNGRARLGRDYANRSKVIAWSDLKSNPSISRISRISVSKVLKYLPKSWA